MKVNDKIRYRIFTFLVKKVYLSVLCFVLILGVVLYITSNYYTDIYIKTTGTMLTDSTDQRYVYFRTNISKKYTESIDPKKHVIWYTKTYGRRYYAEINKVQASDLANSLSLEIAARRKDVNEELGARYIEYNGPVNLEIHFKRKSIIGKIYNKIF